MLAAVESGALVEEDPQSLAIEKAVPAVADRLRSITGEVRSGLAAHGAKLDAVELEMKRLRLSVEDFTDGSFSFHFTPRRTRMLPQGYDPAFRGQDETYPSLRSDSDCS